MPDLMNLMNFFLLALLFGCGGYAVYTAIKLQIKGYLFPNKFLYPGNCSPSDCTDEVGFMSFMLPRLWILGLVCLVTGVVYGLNEYMGLGLPLWFDTYVLPFIGAAIFAWFIVVQTKASKRFW